ncbi:uncharacterized protein LOC112596143 [Melanaphis sacchari]|uniref:uncharacterized protein LOC112596143 n=1 Tax=Melanaphis sacchari TaxID=742174 RepID=UPI000DC1559D|nr:uncharacterized protein LOC112596143 [Melanaphis sacchari]
MEVRDLDQWSSSEEVFEAVVTATGASRDSVKVVSLRKRYGGSQMALVSLPTGSSRGLLSSGRLRIGMVSCRTRVADPKVRCFRCLSYGHMAKDCKGPDRTNCCRCCGEADHKAVGCSALISAVSEFTKLLTAGNSEGKEATKGTK